MTRQFLIVPPTGRRQSWDVHAFGPRGRWFGTWFCDSETIAKLVAKRLRKGQAPGWAGHDSRKAKPEHPTVTPGFPCAVQREGAAYWESVHQGLLEAQKAADILAQKYNKTCSVYKWNAKTESANFVSRHDPS